MTNLLTNTFLSDINEFLGLKNLVLDPNINTLSAVDQSCYSRNNHSARSVYHRFHFHFSHQNDQNTLCPNPYS